MREGDRDISEQIALGQSKIAFGHAQQAYDQRLFDKVFALYYILLTVLENTCCYLCEGPRAGQRVSRG